MNIFKRIKVYKELRKEYENESTYAYFGLCFCLERLGHYEDLDEYTELFAQCPQTFKEGWTYAWPCGELAPRLEAIQNALVEARTLLFCYFILVGYVASCLVTLGMSL